MNIKIGKTTKTWNFVKRLVSVNKHRYHYEGYDLDMSYILPNVIAMGFPSQGAESLYRNSMQDVKNFFNKKYGFTYKIYNLCTERGYKSEEFPHCSQEFRFDDHNPPPFDMMFAFCKDVDMFLTANKDNVCAIHCKAGKGRTGVMICCYLVYSGFSKSAYEAFMYYGVIRTKDEKGVTIPS